LRCRTDICLGSCVAAPLAQPTGQCVTSIVMLAGEKAKLGRLWPHMLHYRPTRVRTCGQCWTTFDTTITAGRSH
jgi:hypothetical protein